LHLYGRRRRPPVRGGAAPYKTTVEVFESSYGRGVKRSGKIPSRKENMGEDGMCMSIFVVGEDEKCGDCNWVVNKVFLMAETEEKARELHKENDRGLCGECLVELMMERGYEIREPIAEIGGE